MTPNKRSSTTYGQTCDELLTRRRALHQLIRSHIVEHHRDPNDPTKCNRCRCADITSARQLLGRLTRTIGSVRQKARALGRDHRSHVYKIGRLIEQADEIIARAPQALSAMQDPICAPIIRYRPIIIDDNGLHHAVKVYSDIHRALRCRDREIKRLIREGLLSPSSPRAILSSKTKRQQKASGR